MRKVAMLGAALWMAASAAAQQPTASQPAETWLWVRLANASLAWNLHAGRWSDNNASVEGQMAVRLDQPQMIDGEAITWVQTKWRISCPDNTLKILYREELNAELAPIFEIKDGQPYPIREGTPEFFMKLIYCENEMLADVEEADGIINMIVALTAAAPAAAPAPP